MPTEFLRFRIEASVGVVNQMLAALLDKVNSRPWMGKEARTCKIDDFRLKGVKGAFGCVEGVVRVRHQPRGWTGGPPLGEIDFNDFDFGTAVESRHRQAGS